MGRPRSSPLPSPNGPAGGGRDSDSREGGCSTDPVTLLKGAGADLTKKETFEAAMKEFSDALAQFESLA